MAKKSSRPKTKGNNKTIRSNRPGWSKKTGQWEKTK